MRLAVLVVAGAVAAAAGEYRHPEMGLSLWVPDAWSVDIDAVSVTAYGEGGAPRLEVRALGVGGSEEAAGERALKRVRARVRQLAGTSGWRAVEVCGARGRRWDGSGLEGRVSKMVRLMVWRGRRTWVMAAWTVERRGAAGQEELWRRIAQGIRAVDGD